MSNIKEPTMRSQSEKKANPEIRIHENDVEHEERTSILGFKNAFFFGESEETLKILVLAGEDTIRIYKPFPNAKISFKHNELEEIKLDNYTITSIELSPNYNIIAFGIISEAEGAMVVVKEVLTMLDKNVFNLPYMSDCIKLSQQNENIASVSWDIGDSSIVSLLVYSREFDYLIGDSTFDENEIGKILQLSFCPIDESIICILSTIKAYFLRIQNNTIMIFSSIEFVDIISHSWISDTLFIAFGSCEGKIYLYRETTPLKCIDTKDLHQQILKSNLAREDDITCRIEQIFANQVKILAYVSIGAILIFDNVNDVEKLFAFSRIVVINNEIKISKCISLHIDAFATNIMLIEKNAVWTANLESSDAICETGMRLVIAQNEESIKQVDLINNDDILLSVDYSDNIILTSISKKQILSIKKIPTLISAICFAFGYQILIADEDGVYIYSVAILDLIKKQKIIDGMVTLMVGNNDKTFVAIVKSDELIIYSMYTMKLECTGTLRIKDTIICCKWADQNETNLAILSSDDTVYFVETKYGKVLWTIQQKLKFFVDICLGKDGTVYALTSKYQITCLQNGREIKSLSVPSYHALGATISTKFINILHNDLYVANNLGVINVIKQNSDKEKCVIKGLKNNKKYNMTFFKIDEMSQKLLLGFENSFVVMISRKREIESSRNNKSMALCDIEEFLNLKDLVTQLDLERNMIRKNSENIIEEYREVKEEEILNIKDTLENNIKIQQEKIKALEKRYDDMEEEKDEFINNLKKENKSDMDKKIDFYENIISEHLRESMRNKNNYFEDIENIKSQNNKKILSLDNTILQIRNEYEEKLRMEKIKQDNLERKLREQNIEILDLCIRVDHKDKEMDKIIQVEKTARLKERENYENEIKDLKANVVILNDEKDVLNDSAAMGRMQIQMLKEELVEKEEKIDEYQKNLSISEKEQELCNATLLEKHKNISLLKSKLFILEHQLKDEKIEKHKSEKHMIEFEIKIEDMARNVYDERKLQHNALSLIAFYKNYAPIPIKSKLNLMKN